MNDNVNVMTFYCVHIVTSVFEKIIINYNNNKVDRVRTVRYITGLQQGHCYLKN